MYTSPPLNWEKAQLKQRVYNETPVHGNTVKTKTSPWGGGRVHVDDWQTETGTMDE